MNYYSSFYKSHHHPNHYCSQNIYNFSQSYLYPDKKQHFYRSLLIDQKNKPKYSSHHNKNLNLLNQNQNQIQQHNKLQQYDYWSRRRQEQKINDKGFGILGGEGMSHKRYISMLEDSFVNRQKTNKQKNKTFSSISNIDIDKAKNKNNQLQKIPYPYTFTQYQILKDKIQQKRLNQQEWLQRQIKRLKKQDQIYELSNKRFNINKKQEQSMKKSYNKDDTRHKFEKKYKNNINQNNIIVNKSQKLQHYPMSSNNSKQQKLKHTSKQGKHTIKTNKQYTQKPFLILNNQYDTRCAYLNQKQRQPHTKSADKIVDLSQENYQQKNKHDYINNELSRSNVLMLDELKQCHSDLQSQQQHYQTQLTFKNINNKNKSNDINIINILHWKPNSKQQKKTQPHLVLSKQQQLTKTPEKKQKINQNSMLQHSYQQEKIKNLSDIKHDRRYVDLLAMIERRQQIIYKSSLSRNGKKNPFNKQVRQKNHNNKQYNSSLLQSEQANRNNNIKTIIKQKILSNQSSIENMQLYNHRTADDQQFATVFSPYKEHKHLPHYKPHYLISSSVDAKKATKQYQNSQQKGQIIHRNNLNSNNPNFHSLIVDQIEKKKIQMMDKDKQLYHSHHEHGQQRYQHKQHSKGHHLIHIGGRTHYQHVQNRQSLNINPAANSSASNAINPYSANISTSFLNGQHLGKNLKIQLQILKQQLEQKNKKVVDLQLQLMQLKSTHQHIEHQNNLNNIKSSQKQFSTAEHLQSNSGYFIEVLQRKKRRIRRNTEIKSNRDTNFGQFEDHECQTSFFQEINIKQNPKKSSLMGFQSKVMSQKIVPDLQLNQQMEKKEQQDQKLIKRLRQRVNIQQQAMNNFFQDLGMYQRQNQQLKDRIKHLQSQRQKYIQNKR